MRRTREHASGIIEYEMASEEDEAYDTQTYTGSGKDSSLITRTPSPGPERPMSPEKRRKAHRLSGVTVARFSKHYQDHGELLNVEPPADVYKHQLRYSREPHRKSCHWKPKKDARPDTNDTGIQAALYGPSTSHFAENRSVTREMPTQTKLLVPVADVTTQDSGQQVNLMDPQKPIDMPWEEIMRLLKGLKKNACPGAHVPEGTIEEFGVAIAELAILIKGVKKRTNQIDATDTEILRIVERQGAGDCRGPHIPEETIHSINKLMADILDFLKKFKKDDYSQLIEFMNGRLGQMNDVLGELRKDHSDIMMKIGGIQVGEGGEGGDGQKCEGPHIPEFWIKDIHGLLMEILTLVKTTTVTSTYMEPEVQLNIMRTCMCTDVVKRNNSDPKFRERGFNPGLCQKCVNDHRGKVFMRNLNLPLSMSMDLVNLIGNVIAAIIDEDSPRLKLLVIEFKKDTPTWLPEEFQKCLEAMLHLALIWDRQSCAQYLASIVDTSAMFAKISENRRIFNICDFVKSAAEGQNPEVIHLLLRNIRARDKVIIINSPAIYGDKKVLSLFEAARRADVKCFEILVAEGAELDLLEAGKGIFHELIRLSSIVHKTAHPEEWKTCILQMLDVLYRLAPIWWRRTNGQFVDVKLGDTVAFKRSALRYLLTHICNKHGQTPLEYAAQVGTDWVIEKIIRNPPYYFLPEAFENGFHSGEVGFVTDNIDSSLRHKGFSTLEMIAQRLPSEAGPILKLEPFHSMIEDKWIRFKPFYFISFICFIAYSGIFTACVFNRPPLTQQTFDEMYQTNEDWARFIGELIVLFCLPCFIYGEIRLAIRRRWKLPPPWDWFGTFRILNICFVIGVLVAFILRCMRHEDEDVILAFCLLMTWTNALQYLGAWRRTGIFTVVMRAVFIKDLLMRFLPAYLLIFAALSTATHCIFQQADPIIPEFTNTTFFVTPFTMLKMTFALMDADNVFESRDLAMGYIVFVSFLFIGILLSFFLLIAMMTNTYNRVRDAVAPNWIWVKANFAMHSENLLPEVFWISYYKRSSDFLQNRTVFGDATLRYLHRIDRRRNHEGKIEDTSERVVLVPRQDPPLPLPRKLDHRYFSQQSLKGTTGAAGPTDPAYLPTSTPRPPKSVDTSMTNTTAVIDMGDTGIYETLDTLTLPPTAGRTVFNSKSRIGVAPPSTMNTTSEL